MQVKEYNIPHINQLSEVANFVIEQLNKATVVTFKGEIGAGKTTLIKELCKQLNILNIVTSPTFALVNEYKTSENSIFHFDLYRIEKIDELYDIGFEEYIYSNNYCFIEWPEIAEKLLPEKHIEINIKVVEDKTRLISISYF